MSQIKIVQLQSSMNSAGKSGLRLHSGFLEAGIDSTIISMNADTIVDKKIIYLISKSKTIKTINTKLEEFQNRKNISELGTFSYPLLGTDISKMEEVKNADILYFHWILGGFLNFSNIGDLFSLNKPVVIIMHDMWWITGGCHHSFTCKKYKTHCFNCPIFPGNKKKDLSYKGFNKKLKIYSKHNNLYFVSPSKWLQQCAKDSFLAKDKPVYYIPNVIDKKIFKPLSRAFSREILNLHSNETIVSFGAHSVDSPYKGWKYLRNALQLLYKDGLCNISVLVFGGGYNKEVADAIPFKTEFVGYLKDEYSLALVYNAIDVFIVPSLADNQPTVVMESLCCGTPVVGFNVGGIPDMISHKENGYLANYKDSRDLADGIRFCIESKITGKILPSFEKNKVVNQHLELINFVLGSKGKIHEPKL